MRVAVYSRYGDLPQPRNIASEKELMAACRAEQIDHLIAEGFTRLGRNSAEVLGLLRELRGAGVKVSLLKEGWVI